MSSNPLRRVGILGGMGRAATVDLMAKVLRQTPATRDEDHVPLIACPPDVDRRLIDPTLALARAIVRHASSAPCGSLWRDVS